MKYEEPKIKPIVIAIAHEFGLNPIQVAAFVKRKFPQVLNKERCANCGASMAIYTFHLDALDGLLLIGMGKIVAENVKKGMSLEEANKVHVQSTLNRYYSVASRTTQCARLGLIQKVLTKEETHDQTAGWSITKRGFYFLNNLPVPENVDSFRNEVVGTGKEMITLSEIHKKADVEYYNEFTHHKRDWVDVSGYATGKQPLM